MGYQYQIARKDWRGVYRDGYGRFAPKPSLQFNTPITTAAATQAVFEKVDPFVDFVYPENTRYMRQDEHHTSFLIEVRPGLQRFRYTNYGRNSINYGNAKDYEVAMPWQYFWIHFEKPYDNPYNIKIKYAGTQIFWATERITSLDSEVFPAMLPNLCQSPKHYYIQYGLGTLCLGSGTPTNSETFAEGARKIIDNTFNSKFNANMGNGEPIPFGDADKWEEESKKNPYFWMDYNFGKVIRMKLSEALKPNSGKPS